MKKSIFTIVLLLVCSLFGYSKEENKTSVPIEIEPIEIPRSRPRAPMMLPIEVWYDSVSGQLQIISMSDVEGEVTLYYEGSPVDRSPMINTVFILSEREGMYTVIIRGSSWTANGSLVL